MSIAKNSEASRRIDMTTVQTEVRKRSVLGHVVKWVFILFNVLMLTWLIFGIGGATEGYEQMSEAEQAGTAIGAGIGVMMILTIWVLGDIILGIGVLLTRGRKIITTTEQ
jgi:hypothetical protein